MLSQNSLVKFVEHINTVARRPFASLLSAVCVAWSRWAISGWAAPGFSWSSQLSARTSPLPAPCPGPSSPGAGLRALPAWSAGRRTWRRRCPRPRTRAPSWNGPAWNVFSALGFRGRRSFGGSSCDGSRPATAAGRAARLATEECCGSSLLNCCRKEVWLVPSRRMATCSKEVNNPGRGTPPRSASPLAGCRSRYLAASNRLVVLMILETNKETQLVKYPKVLTLYVSKRQNCRNFKLAYELFQQIETFYVFFAQNCWHFERNYEMPHLCFERTKICAQKCELLLCCVFKILFGLLQCPKLVKSIWKIFIS